MVIRKAKLEDSKILDDMLNLLVEDVSIKEELIVKDYYKNYIADSKKCIIVAEEDEQIVGYLYGYLIEDKMSFIDAIYVIDNYRNNGIATSLIESFKKWSTNNKVQKIKINVMSENFDIKKICDRQGFEVQIETLICNIE